MQRRFDLPADMNYALRQLDAPYEALASSILLDPAGTERVLDGQLSLNGNVAVLRKYGPASSAGQGAAR